MPKADKWEISTTAKQIRFAVLVKDCGKPETATLWTKPEDNPPFMKAVRENRVLTIVQHPTGSHTESGEIGFHQKTAALYFVFPKRLPKTDARVIGIKFELIEERPATESAKKSPVPKMEPKTRKTTAPIAAAKSKTITIERPKPNLPKKFAVTILRLASIEEKIVVEALNLHDAEAGALLAVNKRKFKPGNIQDEIKAIAEIKPYPHKANR